jgi:hypothetical protein
VLRVPDDWKRHVGFHLTTYTPPGGGARVRCHERIRPLVSLDTLVRRLLDGDVPFQVDRIDAVQRVVTDEGEHAAWARLDGTCEGGPARRYIGAVFTDEYVSALDTLVLAPARFEELELRSRQLLQSVTLGLGERPRRFRYEPPAGWSPLPAGLVTTWLAPGYPDDPSRIIVEPARLGRPPELADVSKAVIAAGGAVEQVAPVVTFFKLAGTRLLARDPGNVRELAILAAAPYRYELHLTASPARADEHRAVFARLVMSAEPIPRPYARVAGTPTSDDTRAALPWSD